MKSMLLLCALIVGTGSLWADEATITFASQTSGTSDGSTAYTTSTFVSAGIASSSPAFGTITCSATSKCYSGKTGYGMKAGASSSAGSFTIAFSTPLTNVTKITLNRASYSDSKTATITVKNGSTTLANAVSTPAGSASFADMEIDDLSISSLSGLTVETSKYCYIKSITVTYSTIVDTRTATTIEIDDAGLNNNLYTGTAAGTLAAIVKAGDATVGSAAVTWSGDNDEVATINATTGAVTLVGVGSVTFTASYAGDEDYKPSTNTYEFEVINNNPNLVTLWSEDFSSYADNAVPTGGTYSYTCVDGGSDTKVYATQNYAGGTAPELLVGKTDGYFQAVVPLNNVQGTLELTFRANAQELTISTSTEGVSISGDDTFNTLGEHTVTFTGITTAMTSITIKFAATSDKNVRLDDIVLKGNLETTATITAAKYATFNSAYALDFSETGISVYTATDNETSVALNEIANGKLPANTPVVLYKADADGTPVNVPVIASAEAISGTNDLHVSTGTDVENMYVLAKKSAIGFYPWNGGSDLSAGKIYLQGKASYGARNFLGFEDNTTAIERIANSQEPIANGQFYDLQGRKVAQPTKGLYIVNGRKVVVK